MAKNPVICYPHRKNKDGTYDSICTRCFATVARTYSEAALAEHDKKHVCEQVTLLGRRLLAHSHSTSPA